MFESIMNFFKNLRKTESKEPKSKNTAKERLHLVLMQDRANVSADFLEMMKQEIIEVIKKYIEVDEKEIDVRLTNGVKDDGTTEAPALYANIPIRNIRNEMKKEVLKEEPQEKANTKKENESEVDKKDEIKEEQKTEENNNIEDNEETETVEEEKAKNNSSENKEIENHESIDKAEEIAANKIGDDAQGDPHNTENSNNTEESNN